MPSSTSSSDAPEGPWGRTWLLAIALACAGIGLCEWSLRASHHHVTVVDDVFRWSIARHRVDAVAVVGTSRMQLAFSSQTFGRDAVNLAIDGVTAPPILDDLADDPEFHGLVVADLAEWELDGDETAARSWIAQSHHLWRAPGALANRELAMRAQDSLVTLDLGGRYVLASALREGAWPVPSWLVTLPSRDRRGDYRSQPEARLEVRRARNRTHIPATAPPPDAWLAATARLDRAVDRIVARGGKVVFVRMPTSGEAYATTNRVFPRALYWDRFAAHTHGIAIHADDIAAWTGIECPDEIHLDERDQTRFTQGLVDALRARGLL